MKAEQHLAQTPARAHLLGLVTGVHGLVSSSPSSHQPVSTSSARRTATTTPCVLPLLQLYIPQVQLQRFGTAPLSSFFFGDWHGDWIKILNNSNGSIPFVAGLCIIDSSVLGASHLTPYLYITHTQISLPLSCLFHHSLIITTPLLIVLPPHPCSLTGAMKQLSQTLCNGV